MALSINFNGTDLSTYGLRVRKRPEIFSQETESYQLLDKAYGGGSVRPAKVITAEVAVLAADAATLLSYLDSIRTYLNQRGDCALKLDAISGRYWNARFESMDGMTKGGKTWLGTITFIAYDPAAYDNDATTSGPTTLDADPHEVVISVGGTEKTFPVYTLTCGETLTDTTVSIENETTGETITWTGDLVATDVLEIDTATGIVKMNDTEDMSSVAGQFPSLMAGSNTLNVAGFGTTGTITTVYRKRYI
jgi:phage-related protein